MKKKTKFNKNLPILPQLNPGMYEPTEIVPGDALDRSIDEYAETLGDPEFGVFLKERMRTYGYIKDPDAILALIDECERMFPLDSIK